MSEKPTIQLQTYRFTFSEEMVDFIDTFARVHQFDDRKTFREEWEDATQDAENKDLIRDEASRLLSTGFKGDPYDKFFKSARYYYRKRLSKPRTKKMDRKDYEGLGKQILDGMDNHVKTLIVDNIATDPSKSTKLISKISPSEAFDDYININKDMILKELTNENTTIRREDVESVMARFKKTYKNRFYRIRRALHNNM